MALPVDITTIDLTGTYVNLEGNPIGGSVRFTPTTIVKDTAYNKILIKRGVTVTLDSNGSFATTLPATDDPDMTPFPFAYYVEELFSGGRSFYLVLPSSSAGTTQDIADLGQAGTSGDALSYITTDEYNALLARYTSANTTLGRVLSIESDTEDAETYATEAASTADQVVANTGISPFMLMGV